jgi:Mg2+ and Co2+ transporter CorA
MNNAMRGLATISTLFLPFTVVSGIFGMNVKVPMRDETNLAPFICLCIAMAFLSALIYIFARCIGWL